MQQSYTLSVAGSSPALRTFHGWRFGKALQSGSKKCSFVQFTIASVNAKKEHNRLQCATPRKIVKKWFESIANQIHLTNHNFNDRIWTWKSKNDEKSHR